MDIEEILFGLENMLSELETHTEDHGDVCYGKELKEHILVRIAAQKDLIDCIRLQLKDPEEPRKTRKVPFYELEDWERESLWGGPTAEGMIFNKALFNIIVRANKVQKTENTRKRIEFLEAWKEENFSRLREWQELNRNLYLDSLVE